MNIVRKPRWLIPDSQATPESIWQERRKLLKSAALLTGAALARPFLGAGAEASTQQPQTQAQLKAARNERFTLDRPLTEERVAASSAIFDEMASDRSAIAEASKGLITKPWLIHIGGAVEKTITVDVEDLARQLGVEERLYRHRCVEAWAMAVPWTGIPMARFVEFAKPLGKAKYVRMISLTNPQYAPAWRATKRVFPYYECLSMAEATNELAFLATGIYGHALPPHHGAPIRLAVPWKYGFKSLKSITAFQFTVEKPGTFWNDLAPDKYSWAANVDPADTIPWPQSQEEILGTGESKKTIQYNGYGEFVAQMYR